jgi:hypothetical protein
MDELMSTRPISTRPYVKGGMDIPSGPTTGGLTELRLTRRPVSRKDRKVIRRSASAQAADVPVQKRRRGEPAPIGGFTGKDAAHWSAYRENLSNVKRKPEARHPPAAKKALRRGGRNLGAKR